MEVKNMSASKDNNLLSICYGCPYFDKKPEEGKKNKKTCSYSSFKKLVNKCRRPDKYILLKWCS
jgi:hypothetical protein